MRETEKEGEGAEKEEVNLIYKGKGAKKEEMNLYTKVKEAEKEEVMKEDKTYGTSLFNINLINK